MSVRTTSGWYDLRSSQLLPVRKSTSLFGIVQKIQVFSKMLSRVVRPVARNVVGRSHCTCRNLI